MAAERLLDVEYDTLKIGQNSRIGLGFSLSVA